MTNLVNLEGILVKYDVYGVGNALVDIQANVSDEILERLEFQKGVMTLVDEEIQNRVLDALASHGIFRSAGGSAANTMLGIADFGGKASYCCKVADDSIGDFYLNDMQQRGVDLDVEKGEGQTGTCVILITEDAERTMLTCLGASTSLGPNDLDEERIKQSKYVYVEGYLFTQEPTRSAALAAIEIAKKNNVKVAFTVSDPFLIQYHRDEFRELIEGPVDLVFCNLDEARAITGKHDSIDCAHYLHSHAENVALTLGANGSLLMHEGETIAIEGAKVAAKDTTGAGDMYAAGILYGITNGLSWKQSGHLASHVAGRVVAQIGARLKEPLTQAEVKAIITEA